MASSVLVGVISGKLRRMLLPQSSARARTPQFSSPEFRTALGMFATGVTIVTARTLDGHLVGLTASSFNSVSLQPPLVLWSLSQAASSMEAFRKGSHYAINILGADQQALAQRFATRGVDRLPMWILLKVRAVRRCWPVPWLPLNALTAAAMWKVTT